MLVAANFVVSDVERMVVSRSVWIVAALDDESVGFVAHDVDFGDQETVDVPRDAPTDVACDSWVAVLASGWTHLCVKNAVFWF